MMETTRDYHSEDCGCSKCLPVPVVEEGTATPPASGYGKFQDIHDFFCDEIKCLGPCNCNYGKPWIPGSLAAYRMEQSVAEATSSAPGETAREINGAANRLLRKLDHDIYGQTIVLERMPDAIGIIEDSL